MSRLTDYPTDKIISFNETGTPHSKLNPKRCICRQTTLEKTFPDRRIAAKTLRLHYAFICVTIEAVPEA